MISYNLINLYDTEKGAIPFTRSISRQSTREDKRLKRMTSVTSQSSGGRMRTFSSSSTAKPEEVICVSHLKVTYALSVLVSLCCII